MSFELRITNHDDLDTVVFKGVGRGDHPTLDPIWECLFTEA
jgi:hypothetical protein